MFDKLAIIVWMVWSIVIIALVLIPLFPNLWRKIGILTYLVLFIFWFPIAYLILLNQDLIITNVVNFHIILSFFGFVLIIISLIIHVWVAKLLGIKAIVGYYVICPDNEKGSLVTSSIFSIVRHPDYLSHISLWPGFFLLTGSLSLLILTFLDLIIIYFIIIPLEEKHLLQRFGKEYMDYKKRVPKFFPRIFRRNTS
ncbi:MAG: isoprenylcysteine carboxylmethyltransferase family protein [Nitrososphaerales archaeon]